MKECEKVARWVGVRHDARLRSVKDLLVADNGRDFLRLRRDLHLEVEHVLLPARRLSALHRVRLPSAVEQHGVLAQLPLKALLHVLQLLDLSLPLGEQCCLALDQVLEVARLAALVVGDVLRLLDLDLHVGQSKGVLEAQCDALLAIGMQITHSSKVGAQMAPGVDVWSARARRTSLRHCTGAKKKLSDAQLTKGGSGSFLDDPTVGGRPQTSKKNDLGKSHPRK